MKTPRNYQGLAVEAVNYRWNQGACSVVLVSPTGSGKTDMGCWLTGQHRTLWVAHRRELVIQAYLRFCEMFGSANVGYLMPGMHPNPSARILVSTVQTLLEMESLPECDILALDECHHYAAAEWRTIQERSRAKRTLGLTATPEREDGKALGDVFDELVVAAQYSELLAAGYLAPWTILQPTRNLKTDLAMDILEAWRMHSRGEQTFIFGSRVEPMRLEASRFRAQGIRAESIDGEDDKDWRDDILARFKSRSVSAIMSVGTLLEGVDAPDASVVVLARNFGFAGGYIQACGRAGRPAKDKERALLIDLCGASLKHGSPVLDRTYSLEGRAISTGPERDTNSRDTRVPKILGEDLVIAPGSYGAELPEVVEFKPRNRSERVQRKIQQISRRSGASVANVMRGVYGGFSE